MIQPEKIWYRRQNKSGPLQFKIWSSESFQNHKLDLVYATPTLPSLSVDMYPHKVMKHRVTVHSPENEISFLINPLKVSHIGPGFCLRLQLESGTSILSEPFHVKDRYPMTQQSSTSSTTFRLTLVRLLRQLEWCKTIDIDKESFLGCPVCGHSPLQNHAADCELYSILQHMSKVRPLPE
jgi:hypothetical protein